MFKITILNRKRFGLQMFLGLTLVLAVGAITPAQAWNPGTHVYLADVLGLPSGPANYREMYGALGLDTFNFAFDPYSLYLADLLHSPAAGKFWQTALTRGPAAWPLGFGFMSHNDVWGADFTAHHNGLTYGQGVGYVIAKATDLANLLPLPPQYGVPPETQLLMNHLVVENAVDVLLAQRLQQLTGSNLGLQVYETAHQRPALFADLLVETYADDLVNFSAGLGSPLTLPEAAFFIRTVEGEFQKAMELYGLALAADNPVPYLAAFLAKAALNYPGLPPISEAELTTLFSNYIFAAINLCNSPSLPGYYWPEIAATIDFVGRNLQENGIVYPVSPVPLPATWWLCGAGLILVGLGRCKSTISRKP